jgi:serine/threonine-protein kinase RsbW
LSAREVVVNAVAHGNGFDAGKPVRVRVWRKGRQFGIEVEDQGAGFDLERVPDPRHGLSLLAAGGRGLHMMRYFMDEVRVERLQPAGTRVSLVKQVQPEAA